MAKFIKVKKYSCFQGENIFLSVWLNVDKIMCFYEGTSVNGYDLVIIEYGEDDISVTESIQEILMLIEQAK